jgi:hypothetical protein
MGLALHMEAHENQASVDFQTLSGCSYHTVLWLNCLCLYPGGGEKELSLKQSQKIFYISVSRQSMEILTKKNF